VEEWKGFVVPAVEVIFWLPGHELVLRRRVWRVFSFHCLANRLARNWLFGVAGQMSIVWAKGV